MSNAQRREFSKRRAVERVLRRLGLHASPAAVIDALALAEEGVLVSQEFVRSIEREFVKGTAELRRSRTGRPVLCKGKLHRRKLPPQR